MNFTISVIIHLALASIVLAKQAPRTTSPAPTCEYATQHDQCMTKRQALLSLVLHPNEPVYHTYEVTLSEKGTIVRRKR